ncbi:hypothetical protein [Microvirga pakistanensis]|uniref:hypothetical protein n=1 Tax=Microvirga pakistanensis TaxID=1682650 RepID=UPI00195B4FFE|nr:hypothetical protein [Microvirga pakistanensis]
MLSWLRAPGNSKAVQSLWIPEMVDRVSRHVEEQVFAITGRRGAPLPPCSSMTDLLIGAYILGALEGYARTLPAIESAAERGNTRKLLRGAATEVCLRVFSPERVRWVRHQLPQWDGPPAYHPTFRQELSSMCCRGARDGRHLAANDPLSFAKAGSLLAFLLEMMEPQV